MKGKKGGWTFNVIFVVVMLLVLGFTFTKLLFKTDMSVEFGDLPNAILDTYHSGEKLLFYIDYSAKNSVYQSAYDLGQKGGFYELSCGDYLGYTLWQDDCYHTRNSLKGNFSLYLNGYLNSYLLGYPEEDILIPENNYDFLIKNNRIVGIATQNIEFDVETQGGQGYGTA